jgi:hypothetical protein
MKKQEFIIVAAMIWFVIFVVLCFLQLSGVDVSLPGCPKGAKAYIGVFPDIIC